MRIMKKSIIFLQIFLFAAFATFAQVDRTKRPEAGPARAPEIGKYEMFELKNGIKVFVVENHKLPRVSMSLILDRDPIFEGAKAGYVQMAGDLIGRGTTNRTKDQLDEEVDFMGASLFTSATSINASGLSKYTEKLVEIMADVAMHPAFTQEEFDKAKEQFLSGIESEKDDAGSIMGNVFNALIYGKDQPYGEIITKETVEAITLEDCKNYYNTYFKPNITYIAVVGDVKTKSIKKLFKKHLEGWASGEVTPATFPLPESIQKTAVAFVDRPSSVQSVIRIGNPIVLKPGDADIDAMRVMSVILGGGSMGRLYNNLRETHGYTYGAYSSFGTDELVSAFYAYAQVRNEVTDSAVYQFLVELEKMRSTPATEAEINQAKASIMGSFGRSLEQPSTIASFALNTARYGLPADYYQNYLKRIEAITAADIQRVAQKYIAGDKLLITVVGKGQEVAPSLEQFGTVNYYDMYANPADAPSFLTMPEGVTAKNVVDNYIKAIGGKDALMKINAYQIVMEGNMAGLPAPLMLTEAKKIPGYYAEIQEIPGMFSQKTIYVNGKAFNQGPQGKSDVTDEEALADYKRKSNNAFSELLYFTEGYTVTLEGQNKLYGKDVYQLMIVDPSGAKTREYYDVATGLKVGEESEQETPQGPVTIVSTISDYKDFGGIKYAGTVVQEVSGQKITMTLKDVKTNKAVSMDLFK